ncbi:septum formation initiator [mine drainage metagenome]|uniref:Septum formation initiator n=1 Tax=mine drainage metagenome TaxID=410659 RepID=A0A1J5QPT8_9ZZZZ
MRLMSMILDFRSRARNVIGPFVGLTLVVYFAYHTVQGDRGLIAWWRLNKEVVQAETTLTGLEAVRDKLDHRDVLLRPDHLDPDMLEERARIMLNMGRDNEVVVLRHPDGTLDLPEKTAPPPQ